MFLASNPLEPRKLMPRPTSEVLLAETKYIRRPRVSSSFASAALLATLLLAGDLAIRSVHAQHDPAPPKVIIAQEFRLVDKAGATRATLQTQPEGSPGIVLYDKSGKVRVTLQVRPDGSSLLAFHDAMSKPRVELEHSSDGTGGLTFTNSKGNGGAALVIGADGNPAAIFKDKDGKVSWTAPEPDIPLVLEPDKPEKKP